uniref:protein S100-A1-like n=1 Tax=Myxine glutinosa TaxID=7769 RepID=UPI00358F8041
MVTDLETAMQTFIEVFHKYAKRAKGSTHHLDQDNLKRLMKAELGNYFQRPGDPKIVKDVMTTVVKGNKQEMNFWEFILLMTSLAFTCNRKYEQKLNAAMER